MATLPIFNRYKPEKSVLVLGFCTGLTFLGGLVFTVLAPAQDQNWSRNTSVEESHYKQAYTAEQEHGRLVYQREGCMYCHTQQIRPLQSEMVRYGLGTSPAPAADEREYVFDEPHFFGTKRNGPDLSRVGGKYSDDWQFSHLLNPAQMSPGSIMPAFTWLFTIPNPADPSSQPVATDDAKALVAYLQCLGSERQIYDPDMNGGKGGWRVWLKPQDAVDAQEASESAVNRAAVPVRVPGGARASTPGMSQVPSPQEHPQTLNPLAQQPQSPQNNAGQDGTDQNGSGQPSQQPATTTSPGQQNQTQTQ